MKRNCPSCDKRYVTSKQEMKQKRLFAPYRGDELMCKSCFDDVRQIAYEQSYFGSLPEWGDHLTAVIDV